MIILLKNDRGKKERKKKERRIEMPENLH